jgi:hypothetical protein
MITHKHKAIFIHIPKTSGTYLEEAILRKQYDAIGWRKAIYHESCPPVPLRTNGLAKIINLYPDYRTFTFVRSPYTRAVSLFLMYSKSNPKSIEYFQNFLEHLFEFRKLNWEIPAGIKLFEKFCELCEGDKSWWPYQLAYHSVEQKKFLLNQNFFGVEVNRNIDFIGKYENLAEDFMTMCDKFKIPKPKTFVQTKIKDYKSFYDNNKKIEMINEIYKEDIELFNYTKFSDFYEF